MSDAGPTSIVLDRFAEISELGASMRRLLSRTLLPVGALLAGTVAIKWYGGSPGASALALISVGTMLVLYTWSNRAIGIPVLPMLALQNLVAYGLPIVIDQQVLQEYPEHFIQQAGLEVFMFSVALAAAWRTGMETMHPASRMCYALQGMEREGMKKFEELGFNMVLAASGFQLLQKLSLLDTLLTILPNGSMSLINALVAGLDTCGFFLAGMMLGRGQMSSAKQGVFWLLLAGNCLFTASSFLLSAAMSFVGSALIGLLWGSGRMPWRYLTVVVLSLSFLSAGKYTMRERYWNLDGNGSTPEFTLTEMPARYVEWFGASVDAFTGGSDERLRTIASRNAPKKERGSLLDRVNNLQNVLWAIDAVENHHIEPLHGATYALIPPLLVPRILWPDKPRSHGGQVLLNVHFGRQDMQSTLKTYIAWGLLAEAYGNFGAIFGALIVGGALGLFCAWLENLTARKLLFSLEGFLSFTIFLGLMSSFEMVASVLVTSLFQSLVPIIIACAPFIERITPRRPAAETA